MLTVLQNLDMDGLREELATMPKEPSLLAELCSEINSWQKVRQFITDPATLISVFGPLAIVYGLSAASAAPVDNHPLHVDGQVSVISRSAPELTP